MQQDIEIGGLHKLFTLQKDCYIQEPFCNYEQRIKSLLALENLLKNNQSKICSAINQDFGNRPVVETTVLEIIPALESIKYHIRYLKSWMRPKRHSTSKWFLPSKSYVQAQPKGVVGIIAPWNYPLLLTIAPLIAALAAGNRVMLKVSEFTPNFGNLISDLIAEKFTESKVAVVQGGAIIAAEFSQLPFDHLFFTGSTATGKKVYSSAAKNLTSVTLELGGKSPAILADETLNSKFIDRIWFGKTINSGQTCIAPDYIWLRRGLAQSLLELSRKVITSRFSNLLSQDYCSIINKSNYERLINLVNDAVSKGAVWQPFSEQWHSETNGDTGIIYKIAPGLLLNCDHTMAIMQEEVFGPIMPVMEYDEFDELFRIMQVVPRPLAIYLFSNDKYHQNKFITNTISGSLIFNNTIVHAAQEALPFGGIGSSGIGRYRGKYGFETFSMLKPIFKQSRLEIFSKFYPPNSGWQKLLLRFLVK